LSYIIKKRDCYGFGRELWKRCRITGCGIAGCWKADIAEVGWQRSDARSQKAEVGLKMNNLYAGSIIGVWILIFGISASGCVSEPSRDYDREFVNTYAELTLLYEKQKMEKKEPDSTYQVMVKEFFESKGWKQEEFKKQAEDLSQRPHVWKLFISDVTATIDSIKNLK
jgi:hypothetical protein